MSPDRMDLALLGADDGPAALGFRGAHRRVRFRHGVTHAVAVRDLEEAVLRRYRTDADGLEQDVVTRITLHEEAHEAGTQVCEVRDGGARGATLPPLHQEIQRQAEREQPHAPPERLLARAPQRPRRVQRRRASPRRAASISLPPLHAQVAAQCELECRQRAEQVHHQIGGGRDQDDEREHADHRAAVVHQHHDRDQRAGDEQRVVRRAVARLVREHLREDLLLRQHARHLALDQDPAVERAEAADECEQRERARGPVAPEQAHHVGERRVRILAAASRGSAGSPPSTR